MPAAEELDRMTVTKMRSKKEYMSGFRSFFILIFMVAFSLITTSANANGLAIDNFEAYGIDTSTDRITYTCDISWNNSWRNTTNYDAVWVFLKYSTDGGVTWSHASMGASGVNPNGFTVPYNFEIVVPSDEKGFFLQRTDLSLGTVIAEGLRFVWDYGQDGLSDAVAEASNTVNKIFGIEMVYIPQGAYYLGDGTSSSDYRFIQGSADDEPWYIDSENAINTTAAAGNGYYYQSSGAAGESATGDVFLIPASFPKGFKSVYAMKYELTEGQWVGFFNTLSLAAKTKRDITSASAGGKNSDSVVDRNTVVWDSSDPKKDATTQRVDRPVTYISWTDMAAYADWAALRPMTELEYEKIARGKDVFPVANEFSWGTASSNDAQAGEIYPSGSDEDGTEQIYDGSSNLNRNSLGWSSGDGRVGGPAAGQKGPLRAGIFAESSTSRTTSGASYYGVLELSGNLSEMVITVGRSQGRQFQGTHGDGNLSTASGYEGNATNIDWAGIDPTDSSLGVTGTVGSGYRGGNFQSSSIRDFQVSIRTNAARDADSLGYSQRYDASSGIFQGGRLVRTAP